MDFCNYKSVIVSVELVHFIGVVSCIHQIAGLVNDSRLAYLEELFHLCDRDFLLPLVSAAAALIAYALDGNEALLALYTYAYGALRH